MKKKYEAMVLTCIDPRFQPIIFNYLKKKNLIGKYSLFAIAGSSIGVTEQKFEKWHKTFWENLDISIKLHKIKKLIVAQENLHKILKQIFIGFLFLRYIKFLKKNTQN